MFNKYLNFHRTFECPHQGNQYFVGDISGQHSLLREQLQHVNFSPDKGDVLYCVGDLINRGPESEACINLLWQKWLKSVLGNHEDLLLSFLENPHVIHKLREVGGQWLDKYIPNDPNTLDELISLVYARMFVAFTVKTRHGDIGVIHSNSPDDWQSIINQELNHDEIFDCLWAPTNYELKKTKFIKNIDAVVSGHINSEKIECYGNQIWIDTLARTDKLTILRSDEIFEVINNAK